MFVADYNDGYPTPVFLHAMGPQVFFFMSLVYDAVLQFIFQQI